MKIKLLSAASLQSKSNTNTLSVDLVALLPDGKKISIYTLTQLQWYRRLAIGWEDFSGNSVDPSVISETLRSYNNGVYQ